MQAHASRKPLLVLFSETGCPWCECAQLEFLLPTQSKHEYRAKELFRQIDIDQETPLRGFGGGALAEPRLGFGFADFYSAYLLPRVDHFRGPRLQLFLPSGQYRRRSAPQPAPKRKR